MEKNEKHSGHSKTDHNKKGPEPKHPVAPKEAFPEPKKEDNYIIGVDPAGEQVGAPKPPTPAEQTPTTPPPGGAYLPKGDQVKPESSADMLKKVLSKMNKENTGAGKIKGMDLAICKIEEALAYIEGRQDLPENIK